MFDLKEDFKEEITVELSLGTQDEHHLGGGVTWTITDSTGDQLRKSSSGRSDES